MKSYTILADKKIFTISFSKIFISCFVVVVCATYVLDNYFNLNESKKSSENSIESNIDFETIVESSQLKSCSIIHSNISNFNVIIDGVKYPKYVPLLKNKRLNFECMKKINNKPKIILFWTTWFGDPKFEFGIGKYTPFINSNCPVTNCETTNDKSRLAESNYIVFHMADTIGDLPPTRHPDQQWIFLLYESPVKIYNFSQYNNLFNISSTYRLDSQFSSIYYDLSLEWGLNSNFNINQNFSINKTNMAAAVISNCGASSKRLDYIKQMQQIVSVDIFGACGKECPKITDNDASGDCKYIIANKYKFYLSFENSICKDYITEKFFAILNYNIIPVVYGGGPYEAHIPKSGFINAFDFESPKHLAQYLLYLDSNSTAYNEYFKWKRYFNYVHKHNKFTSICEMCIKLNIEEQYGIQRSAISDMNKFWSKTYDCKRVSNVSFKLTSY